jgi:GTP-binding protein
MARLFHLETMVKFIRSVFDLKDLPSDGKPEIAFVGRSNVGKSSLINALAFRKDLAKVSRTPGKTQSLNFYDFDSEFYLVDMPGYGFARSSKENRLSWGKLIETYLDSRKELKAIAILIDSRHIGIESDVMVLEWLNEREGQWLAILTKSDKVIQSHIAEQVRFLREGFPHCREVCKTSSQAGKGIRETLAAIKKLTKQ